jgi:S-DNA-T family DNA segregation ATPase FtsK/SpoIIIE
MAKNTYKTNTFKDEEKGDKGLPKLKFDFFKDKKFQLSFGFFLLGLSVFLLISFISYLFTGKADQSVVNSIIETGMRTAGLEAENWLGLFGAYTAHYFIFEWFGIASLLLPPLFFIIGIWVVYGKAIYPIERGIYFVIFFLIWLSTTMGFVILSSDEISVWGFLGGNVGYELAVWGDSLMGWGTAIFLAFTLLIFSIYYFDITEFLLPSMGYGVDEKTNHDDAAVKDISASEVVAPTPTDVEIPKTPVDDGDLSAVLAAVKEEVENEDEDDDEPIEEDFESWQIKEKPKNEPVKTNQIAFEIEEAKPEPIKTAAPKFTIGALSDDDEKTVDSLENYDPTLDLPNYKYPTPELLNEYPEKKVQVSREELEANKDKIVETLINFKIGISSIKATTGPTVTLYEIVPEAGIKISKIKNLEDDIALNLAALGIRIIAPIPGKGTIGIEVPNKNREMVDARSVITTEKFAQSKMELPIVLGKTVSNEVYVTDLAKMPHLLMAGATGQGKSVGLNILLTSLLYKKHPSQLKLVLVDPKKVELTLFNKIERHFLAKLPNTEDAIITDTKKVIYTLNSLCMEMDNRYDLLKEAGCRNLKEYNVKFVERKLNPLKGHKFLPYIVLVIDELADLMMTAGKEVETPIARLAQLARAIGIHLVVATQRPSVNVITGIIKANFPARLSFRVTSKIDSRTILDTGGADQLVGMGDMLLSQGSDLIRLQCAFVDTPEVERICDWIGEQRGYDDAYLLPEFEGDEDSMPGTVDLADRDALFDDAARLIVSHQQGSTSLIQRKLKLGYNRAGRLIDQLEAAGIVGPFEGSKAREVYVKDEYSLEQILTGLSK